MVLKQVWISSLSILVFENDVKMYGTQTEMERELNWDEFENDVKMYGTQTNRWNQKPEP